MENQIILYQNELGNVAIDVVYQNENFWLTQKAMSKLFDVEIPAISKHLKNIFESAELVENSVISKMETTATDGKKYLTFFYNLDAIIAVGYRVNSKQATHFRVWATRVLKEYLMKGYAISQRFERIEERVTNTERQIDFFVKTALPPVEGILFDGQIFDAYAFVSNLIKSAKKSIVLIDNYVDETVLLLLSKRKKGVSATIYTQSISAQLKLDLKKHNAQYPPIIIKPFDRSHDRFLFIDNDTYHIGASLKDLGKKWFAFSKMNVCPVVFGLP